MRLLDPTKNLSGLRARRVSLRLAGVLGRRDSYTRGEALVVSWGEIDKETCRQGDKENDRG